MPLPFNLITGRTARILVQNGLSGVERDPNGTIRLVIPGPAPGKPRMTRRDKWAQRECVMRYRDWCDRVRQIANGDIPAAESVAELNWAAFFAPPKSWSKKRRVAAIGTLYREKPDRDNIDKAILDCLFQQDKAIAVGRIEKRWDWHARLEIEIVVNKES